MATSADIGASFSSYTGNAALGGGSTGSVTLETKPLEELAKYTLLYNHAEYNQRQKDADTWATEISDATSYDLANAIPEYAKAIQNEYKDFIDWTSKNTDSRDYKKNPQRYLEYKKRKQKMLTMLQAGKKQEVLFRTRMKAIEDNADASTRAAMMEALKKEIKDKDIFTPIEGVQKYDLRVDPLPAVGKINLKRVIAGSGTDATEEINLIDQKSINALSDNLQFKTQAAGIGISDAEFESKISTLPEAEKQKERIRRKNEMGNSANPVISAWLPMAKNINDVFNSKDAAGNYIYRDANGKLDINKAKNSTATASLIENIEAYNEYIRNTVSKIDKGLYKDYLPDGMKANSDGNFIDKRDYKEIDISSGNVSVADLAKLELYSKAVAGLDKKSDLSVHNTNLQWATENRLRQKQDADIAATNAPTGGSGIDIPINNMVDFFKRVGSSFAESNNKLGSKATIIRLPPTFLTEIDRAALGASAEDVVVVARGKDGKNRIIITDDKDWTDNIGTGKFSFDSGRTKGKKHQLVTADAAFSGYIGAVRGNMKRPGQDNAGTPNESATVDAKTQEESVKAKNNLLTANNTTSLDNLVEKILGGDNSINLSPSRLTGSEDDLMRNVQ